MRLQRRGRIGCPRETPHESGWSLRNWRASRSKKKAAPPAGIDSPLIFQDGFGTRWTGLDAESGRSGRDPVVQPGLRVVTDFAGAVGERVARLARVRHTLYARTRRLDRPDRGFAPAVFRSRAGLATLRGPGFVEKDKLPVDIGAVLAILRQLIPAVALFSRHQRDAAIGTVGPERVLLTPQGRLVLAEYALAPGLESLQYSRDRLWRDLRVTLPATASPSRIPPSADVLGMGVVTLSLLLGRVLTEDEFLFSLGDLAASATESVSLDRRPLSAGLSVWLGRALQLDERMAFQSPQEAQVAFEEMLAKERGYVTTPAQLDLFVSRVERGLGPPAAMPAPPSLPVGPGATCRVDAERCGARARRRRGSKPSSGSRRRHRQRQCAGAASTRSCCRQAGACRSTGGVKARVGRNDAADVRVCDPSSPAQSGRGGAGRTRAGRSGRHRLAGVRRSRRRSRSRRQVVIQSRPVAARVLIDGEEKGITPLTTSLAPGAHIVEVRVGRSEPRVIPVDVKQGVQNSHLSSSCKAWRPLAVSTSAPSQRVRRSPSTAARVATTPLVLRDLAPGDHEVLLEAGRQKDPSDGSYRAGHDEPVGRAAGKPVNRSPTQLQVRVTRVARSGTGDCHCDTIRRFPEGSAMKRIVVLSCVMLLASAIPGARAEGAGRSDGPQRRRHVQEPRRIGGEDARGRLRLPGDEGDAHVRRVRRSHGQLGVQQLFARQGRSQSEQGRPREGDGEGEARRSRQGGAGVLRCGVSPRRPTRRSRR